MDMEKRSTGPAPHETQIAGLKWRLARAESDRDTWRVAGMQENYLGACSMVDALTLQLDQLERIARLPVAPSEAELELMRTLGISFADGVFHWREYRYDRLADAVAYARH